MTYQKNTLEVHPLNCHVLSFFVLDGRRPIYLYSLPFLAIGSIGVGTATSVPQLMIARVIQSIGSSAGMSVGSGIIGDIFRLEERGFAMGIYFSVSRSSEILHGYIYHRADAYFE